MTVGHGIVLYDIILLVGEIYYLALQIKDVPTEKEFMRHGESVLGISVNLIHGNVLRQAVTLAHPHYRIAHIDPGHVDDSRHIAAVPGSIRKLMLVAL